MSPEALVTHGATFTLTDVFWIAVAIVIVFALLVSIDWHRGNRGEADVDSEHEYLDRRAEVRAQLAKLQQTPPPPTGDLEEARRRMANGKRPAVKGYDAQRLRRRES